jgi:alkylation response protein AidB-like acyl-CoA dehydrogenase
MVYRGAHAMDSRHPKASQYCAMAKRYATDAGFEVANQALQLHGGAGNMNEYPIARIWRDARVRRIYGGSSEIMRELVGRSL